MGISLGQLKDRIRTSIHGRRLGLDDNDFLVGPKGLRSQVTNATSDTTGTAIPNNGTATVYSSTDDTWNLDTPVPGCEIALISGGNGGNCTVSFNGATAVTSNGVASSAVILQGADAHVVLRGLSTSEWGVTSVLKTTASGSVQFTS